MSTCVFGKDAAAAACYPRILDNEEPVVVLIVVIDREASPIALRVREALQLGSALVEAAKTIQPSAAEYDFENKIMTDVE